jgi:hypothetical protein
MALNSRVCADIKGKQEQNWAITHCIDAHAKVLASIRWAHKPGPGYLTAGISWREMDEILLAEIVAECLASAYAQWKAQKRAESAPLS